MRNQAEITSLEDLEKDKLKGARNMEEFLTRALKEIYGRQILKDKEREKAEAILNQLEGLSITSAQSLLDLCSKLLLFVRVAPDKED